MDGSGRLSPPARAFRPRRGPSLSCQPCRQPRRLSSAGRRIVESTIAVPRARPDRLGPGPGPGPNAPRALRPGSDIACPGWCGIGPCGAGRRGRDTRFFVCRSAPAWALHFCARLNRASSGTLLWNAGTVQGRAPTAPGKVRANYGSAQPWPSRASDRARSLSELSEPLVPRSPRLSPRSRRGDVPHPLHTSLLKSSTKQVPLSGLGGISYTLKSHRDATATGISATAFSPCPNPRVAADISAGQGPASFLATTRTGGFLGRSPALSPALRKRGCKCGSTEARECGSAEARKRGCRERGATPPQPRPSPARRRRRRRWQRRRDSRRHTHTAKQAGYFSVCRRLAFRAHHPVTRVSCRVRVRVPPPRRRHTAPSTRRRPGSPTPPPARTAPLAAYLSHAAPPPTHWPGNACCIPNPTTGFGLWFHSMRLPR